MSQMQVVPLVGFYHKARSIKYSEMAITCVKRVESHSAALFGKHDKISPRFFSARTHRPPQGFLTRQSRLECKNGNKKILTKL